MKVKVKVIRATIAAAQPVEPGQTIEVEREDALLLVRLKKAIPASKAVAAQMGLGPETATDPATDEAEKTAK